MSPDCVTKPDNTLLGVPQWDQHIPRRASCVLGAGSGEGAVLERHLELRFAAPEGPGFLPL